MVVVYDLKQGWGYIQGKGSNQKIKKVTKSYQKSYLFFPYISIDL
jgi:hypothetical protein